MSFSISGSIHKIFDEQRVSDRFRKRDFVLYYDDNGYPQHVRFQVVQDRCQLLDTIKTGQNVTVHFDLTGKEYIKPGEEPRYYTDLRAWKIDLSDDGKPSGSSNTGGGNYGASPKFSAPSSSTALPDAPPIDDEDLPF